MISSVCGVLCIIFQSGKTTIAQKLQQHIKGSVFKDADEFHSEQNKQKMSSGIPLTDEDRYPWLQNISNEVSHIATKHLVKMQEFIRQTKYKDKPLLIVTCSALKQKYREVSNYYISTLL